MTGLVAAPGIRCRCAVGSSAAGVGAAAGGPAGRLVAAVGRRPRRRHAGELAGSNSPRCHNSTGGDSWSVGLQAPPHPAAAMYMLHITPIHVAATPTPTYKASWASSDMAVPVVVSTYAQRYQKFQKLHKIQFFSACKQGKGVIYVQNMANPLTNFLKLPA